MNALQLFSFFFLWIKRWFCCACILFLCNGCAWFSVPLCEFDKANVACLASSDSDGGIADLTPLSTKSPLGPLRNFERRAGINNNQEQKFVGILQKKYAITLLSTPAVSFSAVQFHLDRPEDQKQLEEVKCPDCPLVTNIQRPRDSVYLANDAAPAFWLLRQKIGIYASYKIDKNGDLTDVDTEYGSGEGISQPFFHPILDACLIPAQNLLRKYDILHLTVGSTNYKSEHSQNGKVTAAMIGDLDATDSVKNGIEVVRFDGAAVASVYHYDPIMQSKSLDTYLQMTINDEINRRIVSPDEKIGAAYVNDLNGDGFLDFVFSLGVNVFVSSYKGKTANSSLPVFEAWPKKVLSVPADEAIQSIMAMDITKDGYPELIVVTDKFVHFYLNTPK